MTVASHLLASVRTLFACIRTSLSLVGSGIVLGRLYMPFNRESDVVFYYAVLVSDFIE